MYDQEVVRKHLAALVAGLRRLRDHAPVDGASLRQNPDLLWILERGVYLCIQNLLDVLAHIVAAEFSEEWDSYADVARVLHTRQFISDDQQALLLKMIGLRNRLSHDYLGLDTEVLLDIVNHRLDDFLPFAWIIARSCDLNLDQLK